ncbi:MAG TPA: DUF47 family protein [Methanoregula sp.]|nr:DUF47 family protein [Methanoregula sp.]
MKIPGHNREGNNKHGIFASLFPREHDFYAMLDKQAEWTVVGVREFVNWLTVLPLASPDDLEEIENAVDLMRHDMEDKLIRSFSTPFDRQDIYSISRQMDYILNFSKETAKEMVAFSVVPDEHIRSMARQLLEGTESIGRGIGALDSDKDAVENEIRCARRAYNILEEQYITGMAELLRTNDAMQAIRTREIYHHLRDAGRAMRDTLDILHNAVIDLA